MTETSIDSLTFMPDGNTFPAKATRLTSKGQVTIPSAIRRRLGAGRGDEISFVFNAQGEVVVRKGGERTAAERLAGVRGTAGPGPTTDELMRLLRGEPGE